MCVTCAQAHSVKCVVPRAAEVFESGCSTCIRCWSRGHPVHSMQAHLSPVLSPQHMPDNHAVPCNDTEQPPAAYVHTAGQLITDQSATKAVSLRHYDRHTLCCPEVTPCQGCPRAVTGRPVMPGNNIMLCLQLLSCVCGPAAQGQQMLLLHKTSTRASLQHAPKQHQPACRNKLLQNARPG
jgi:hypothetical protein